MADLTDGYEMLAQFRVAAAMADDGDSDGAVANYMMLAENKSIKPLYQQAALLLAVMNAPDGTDPKQSQDQLAPLTATPGPWQGLALEQSAALDLEKNNRPRRSKSLSPFLPFRNSRRNCASVQASS